jgi:response regulator aspartate phosphatase F
LDVADSLASKGYDICSKLGNVEYIHHFSILKKLIKRDSMKELENAVLEGISYFEGEELYSYVSQCADELAMKFYGDENLAKAGQYFYVGFQARQKKFEREALK